MKEMKAKLNKQGGFTLIEMLIVVAIIAILIAIAIPMVNSSLERAREATDEANMRGAIGLAYVEIMSETGVLKVPTTGTSVAYYKVTDNKGTLAQGATGGRPTGLATGKGYGKGTSIGDDKKSHVGQYIKLTVNTDGDVTGEWVD